IISVGNYGSSLDASGSVPMAFADPNWNQPRGLAWELRTIAEAAYLTPDGDPLKSYFNSELVTALHGLVQEFIIDNVNGQYGELNGSMQGFLSNGYHGWDAPW